jgi:hypothetical protein
MKVNRSRRAEFHLMEPFARSVKLAADFTKRETFSLDLIFDIFQKTVRVTLQVVGCILTAGLAVILVLIWILIEPVFQLVEKARQRDELNNQTPGGDAIHRGIGLALLVLGILMIVYGFNASGSVIPDVPPAFTGAPTAKTVGLLLGGSAAVVVGVTLAIRGSGKSSNRTRSKPGARKNQMQKP